MASRFTSADLELVEEAIVVATLEGYARLSIAGQDVQRYELDQLLEVRDAIKEAIGISTGVIVGYFNTVKLISPAGGV